MRTLTAGPRQANGNSLVQVEAGTGIQERQGTSDMSPSIRERTQPLQVGKLGSTHSYQIQLLGSNSLTTQLIIQGTHVVSTLC